MSDADVTRYHQAAHAMQTAVAIDHARNGERDVTPKHTRVGINSAMVNAEAVATLLMDKGIFTLDEYHAALAAAMEREVARYRDELGLPDGWVLG